MERVVVKYSEAFKLHVVKELEEGKLSSMEEAKLRYGIGGGSTISKWVRKYGKNKILTKIVRVEMPDERSEIERLRKENQMLKAALADTTVRDVLNRAYFEVVCEDFGVTDVEAYKKKLDTKVSKKLKTS